MLARVGDLGGGALRGLIGRPCLVFLRCRSPVHTGSQSSVSEFPLSGILCRDWSLEVEDKASRPDGVVSKEISPV